MGRVEKVGYLSKSKVNLFLQCPLAFKFHYVDNLPRTGRNPFFEIGTDVHEFIKQFHETVLVEDNGELSGLNRLRFAPNTEYKKNIVRFEILRWRRLHHNGFGADYFKPLFLEHLFDVGEPILLHGYVDRIHRVCRNDDFAPLGFPGFKDGDLVIVENKSGARKSADYENDLLWYKLLFELSYPGKEIKWGAVYYPIDNAVSHFSLTSEKSAELYKSILLAKSEIEQRLASGRWDAKPSAENCCWCEYARYCKEKVC